MRRRVLIALLAFGTLAGYSSGFASLYRWNRYGSSYGGHCRSWKGHPSRYDTAPQHQAPPGPQAQASASDAPAEPGPR
ncbi:hypothetical protein [Archangium sp.]|uniref:hypothetical protein n=1 Tax=Archangium sp. TaxID=1872627 RepID=UPI00286A130C|nr:hypothetical protein [Archangium sp.]